MSFNILDNSQEKYFYRTQVQTVKRVQEFLTVHPDRHDAALAELKTPATFLKGQTKSMIWELGIIKTKKNTCLWRFAQLSLIKN
ncbi:hypothetical protein LQE92_02885 [Lacrimispora sp. NSJ-141]|uniref:Uncharacterized protein n=1 Tax=Lientehia hominis TaxID=2897778 RepID=A0AAP2RIP2_9FIRM|nr:hypothetical protein [Lientehia hominis]MCD2491573.1 hypothetical protein [Lientehia hominis]